MGKNRMIAKSCPQCHSQVAVASKSCPCGHTFFSARRAADSLPAAEDPLRRTSRVCRAQPKFYDAMEFMKKKRVAVASKSCSCGQHTFFSARRVADSLPAAEDPPRRTSRVCRAQAKFYDAMDGWMDFEKIKRSPKKRSMSRSIDEDYKKERNESATARARRRRALRRAKRETPPPGERARDPTPQLRPAQLATCALILQEINRKMQCVTWQPQF